jgi:DNA-binding IclR family transcriptional regulator
MKRKGDARAPALRALEVLEAVVAGDGPASLTEIATRCQLPMASAHRLLAQLQDAGWARREPGGRRFDVGSRATPLAMRVLSKFGEAGARRAILERLVKQCGETCNLSMVDRRMVLYVERVESASPLRLAFRAGTRVPLHCTASGKLLLALMPAAKRARVLDGADLERHTANTIGTRAALEAELKRVRTRRVGTDNEEYVTGLLCLAVPVAIDGVQAFAALTLQAPIARMALERAMAHVPALERAAAELARTFA